MHLEVVHFRALLIRGNRVFAVAGHTLHVEALTVGISGFAVGVDHVVSGALVAFLPHAHVYDVFAHEGLVINLGHLHFSVFQKNDDVVDVGAFGNELVFFEPHAYEAFFAIHVELRIISHHGGRLDVVELRDLGFALAALAVFFQNILEVRHGIVGEVFEVVFGLSQCLFQLRNFFVRFEGVVFRDAADANFGKARDVFLGDVAHQFEALIPALFGHRRGPNELLQPRVDDFEHGFPALGLFDLAVDAILDEDLFERGEVPFLFQLGLLDAQLPFEQVFGVLRTGFEDVVYGEEMRFVVYDHAGVGRVAHPTIGEGVERVHCHIGRNARSQVHENLHILGRIVGDLLDLNFALIVGLHHAIDQALGGHPIGQVADGELILAHLLDAGAHLHFAAALALVVIGHIHGAAGGEIGKYFVRFALQNFNGSFDQLHKIVRQDLGAQSHRDAVRPLGQQQRKFHRQRQRLLLPAVVGHLPLGGLGVEGHVEGKLSEARLDVARGRRPVARAGIAPIALAVDEQVFLAEVDERIPDGGIAVGVVLHRLADYVGYLVKTAVVHLAQRVQNAALHGLEAVVDGGHGAFQDDVTGVVQKVILKHAFQRDHVGIHVGGVAAGGHSVGRVVHVRIYCRVHLRADKSTQRRAFRQTFCFQISENECTKCLVVLMGNECPLYPRWRADI